MMYNILCTTSNFICYNSLGGAQFCRSTVWHICFRNQEKGGWGHAGAALGLSCLLPRAALSLLKCYLVIRLCVFSDMFCMFSVPGGGGSQQGKLVGG